MFRLKHVLATALGAAVLLNYMGCIPYMKNRYKGKDAKPVGQMLDYVDVATMRKLHPVPSSSRASEFYVPSSWFSAIYKGMNLRRSMASEEILHPKRYAMVRPVGLYDTHKLVQAFKYWDEFPPCICEKEHRPFIIDLYISLSQTYQANPAAQEEYDAVSEFFTKTNGWNGCFANLKLIEANISPEEDIYMPKSLQNNVNWVNGPNRQFEHAFRFVQHEGGYDAMIIFEADARPQVTGWLDKLIAEVDENRPFAILGSKYDGHSWDKFLDKIPLALLHHINGNAVYNTSHPLLNHLISELEEEGSSKSMYNAIPYDYRISQMILEGSLGDRPNFPYKAIQDENGQPVLLPSKTEKFQDLWNRYGKGEQDDAPIKESNVITNYAATNFLPKHVKDASIVHGKSLFEPWEPERHRITLIVSDWTENYFIDLLSNLDACEHPFVEVLVMVHDTDDENKLREERTANQLTKVPVTVYHRMAPDHMDLCEARVSTEWFLMTDAYHRVATDVDLMFTADGTHRPVIPYAPSIYDCNDHKVCKETMSQAQNFYANMDHCVNQFDMLYKTAERNEFCAKWKSLFGSDGENVSLVLQQQISLDGPKGPTATSYLAYLYSVGKADDLYYLSDVTIHGTKTNFIKVLVDEELKNYEQALRKFSEDQIEHRRLEYQIGDSCTTNSQCDTGYCNPKQNVCANCKKDNHCDSGKLCWKNKGAGICRFG